MANNKTLQDIVRNNGGWRSVLNDVSTALTPVWVTRMMTRPAPIEQTRGLSNFVMPSGRAGINLIGKIRQDRSAQLFSEISQYIGEISDSVIKPWKDAVDSIKNVSQNIRKIVYGNGDVSTVIERNGKYVVNNAATSERMLGEINKPLLVNDITQQRQAKAAILASRINTPGSTENLMFQPYTKRNIPGQTHDIYGEGWDGLVSTIRMLPTPSEYLDDRHSVVMGYVANASGRGYIGASIGVCDDNTRTTLHMMMNKALSMGLNIPPRDDGMVWTTGMEIDSDVEESIWKKSLMGMRGSPFFGTQGLISGTDILIRDRNLVDASTVSKSFAPAQMELNIRAWKSENTVRNRKEINEATSVENKQIALDRGREIQALSAGFIENAQKRAKSIHEETRMANIQREADYVGVVSSVPYNAPSLWDDDDFGKAEHDIRLTPAGNRTSLTWSEASALGLKLTPHNTSIDIDRATGVATLRVDITQLDRNRMGLQYVSRIDDDNTIPLRNLSEGTYIINDESNMCMKMKGRKLVIEGADKDFPAIEGVDVYYAEEEQKKNFTRNFEIL